MKRRVDVRSVAVTVGVVVAAATLGSGCTDSPERSAEALCAELEATQGLDESLAVADAEALAEQADALDRATAVAPPEIEAAVGLLADVVGELATTLGTATGDRRDALGEALAERQDQVDALTEAGRSVSDWSRANCGLDLDTGESVPTTTPPTTPATTAEGATTNPSDDGAAPAPATGPTP